MEDFEGKVAVVSTPGTGECGVGIYTDKFVEWLREDNICVDRWEVPHESVSPLQYIWVFYNVLRSNVDIVHLQYHYPVLGKRGIWTPIICLMVYFSAIPSVITIHGVENPDESENRIRKGGARLMNYIISITFDHYLFLNNPEMEDFKRQTGIDSNQVSRTHHGIYAESLEIDETKEVAKQEMGYDLNKPLIVEPGYVRKQKGCKKFAQIAKNMPNLEFLVAGGVRVERNKPYLEEVKSLSPQNMEITGVLPEKDLKRAITAADLIVLPYNSVSQSGILNWCIGIGKPVITTPLEQFNSLNRKFGYPLIFKEDSPEEMADEIDQLLDDSEKIQEVKSNAKDLYETRHYTKVISDNMEVYSKLYSTRSR